MSRPLGFLLAALTSCSVALDVPDDARVSCVSDGDCPRAYRCNLSLCISDDTPLTEVAVAFTLPRDGDLEFGLTSSIVIVLNMNVVVPPPEIVTLASTNGFDRVEVDISAPGATNTLIVTPRRRLFPETEYLFTVAPGMYPEPGLFATLSSTTWMARFTTAASSDDDAPLPVTNVVVDRGMDSEFAIHQITWTQSASADLAASLVLRSSTGPVVDAPEASKSYVLGQTIGDAIVVFSGVASTALDSPSGADDYYYAVFAVDTALNYSVGESPPVARLGATRWCPDQTGMIRIDTPETASEASGGGQVQVLTSPFDIFIPSKIFPSTPTAFGVDLPIGAGAPFIVGTVVYLRPVGISASGEARFVGPGADFPMPSGELAIGVVSSILIGETADASFNRQQWNNLEAEVDTDPAAGGEAWSPATINGDHVNAVIDARGTWRLRVRVNEPGCAPGPWSTSNEFITGTDEILYVRQGGTGAGLGPSDAAPSISAVYDRATNGSTVRVAGGTYTDSVSLRNGVRYLGGYSNDFATRDPATNVTTVNCNGSQPVIRGEGALSSATLIDGFVMQCNTNSFAPVTFGSSASATFSNNRVDNQLVSTGTEAIRVQGASPIITGNTIHAALALGVFGGAPVIENNTITGGAVDSGAVTCASGSMLLRSNVIIHQRNGGPGTDFSIGVDVKEACAVEIVDNIIIAGRGGGSTTTSSAIRLGWGSGDIFNNLIATEGGGQTWGIWFTPPPVEPTVSGGNFNAANNTIHTGRGTAARGNRGAARKGFMLDTGNGSYNLQWVLRLTNNLIFGEGDYDGFTLDSDFLGLESVENNVVLAPNTQVFLTRYTQTTSAVSQDVATAEAASCSGVPLIIMQNNRLVNALPTDVFVNVGGIDANDTTIQDNDWDLQSTAATLDLRTGGITLELGSNCGAPTCGAGNDASCGVIEADYEGATRTAPYSIGAYEE